MFWLAVQPVTLAKYTHDLQQQQLQHSCVCHLRKNPLQLLQLYCSVILSQDCLAAEEQDPILPKLQPFLKDKKLIAARAAVEKFDKLLQQFGGPKERQRWQDFQEKLTVLCPDPFENCKTRATNANSTIDESVAPAVLDQTRHGKTLTILSGRVEQLQAISKAQKEVFALGDDQRALTLTANGKASEFAARQGVRLVVHVHRAVWLTGQ